MTTTERTVLLLTTIACGLSAGVFFAFSTFVMPAIRRLPAEQATSAMQSVNKLAGTNGLFLLVLFAPLVTAVYLIVRSVRAPERTSGPLIAAGVFVLIGVALTVVYHVPHNDALAKVTAGTPAGDREWHDYAGPWAAWNHVRTVAFTAATALFALTLRVAD